MEFTVVGAGISGITIAEQIATKLKCNVQLIEQREHIGGNCYDYYDDSGVLIHKHGPHIFHTNNREIWEYLCQFTRFNGYQHRVMAWVEGDLLPFPFNLNTLEKLNPKDAEYYESRLIEVFGYGSTVPLSALQGTGVRDLVYLGELIYNLFYYNYTKKQWAMNPEKLDPAVIGRVPIRVSRDDRYFTDKYQGVPENGYTAMFEKMVDNRRITVELGTKYTPKNDEGAVVIYTGMVDEYFNYKHGELEYRSLNFHLEHLNEIFHQSCGVVNYPDTRPYTRIVEYKHLTYQRHPTTTIVLETPTEYMKDVNLPYYPIPNPENKVIYERYEKEASEIPYTYFMGRLGKYKYINMDEAVEDGIAFVDGLKKINFKGNWINIHSGVV